jgi:hypothetical protein
MQMSSPLYRSTAAAIVFVGMTATIPTIAKAQGAARTLADNEAIFIDGQALTVTPGSSKDDVVPRIANLHAHPIGAGAIVFRSGLRLYVIDGASMSAAMAMYNPETDRQRSYGGGNDDRQRSYGGLYDPYPGADRQRSYGGLNDDRQRSYGGLYDPYPGADRQRSYGGLNDDRQRSYGGLYDPDYANYRLKTIFDTVWSTTGKN